MVRRAMNIDLGWTRRMARLALHQFVFCLLLGNQLARAQDAAPPGMSLAEAAEKRFPQPVVVETLIGRTVLQPLESQPILGHVAQIVRRGSGAIAVVVDYGGTLGFGSHPIAVPVQATVLLGQYMEIVDFTPDQLSKFPTFDAAGTTSLSGHEIIKVGLARPSH